MTLTFFRIGIAAATLACQSAPVRAQTPAEVPRSLHALNLAVTELTARVSPSVVQVLVTGYRMVGNSEGGTGVAIPATVVGIAKDVDLALLKIDRNGLTPLPLADYDTVRPSWAADV